MRKPSSRILKNKVSVYPAIGGPDIDGGPQYVYAKTPTAWNVPASVQYTDTMEIVEGTEGLERVSQVNAYKVFFSEHPVLKPRDKIVWVESGVTHDLIVQANPPSEAGRHSVFVVRAHEFI